MLQKSRTKQKPVKPAEQYYIPKLKFKSRNYRKITKMILNLLKRQQRFIRLAAKPSITPTNHPKRVNLQPFNFGNLSLKRYWTDKSHLIISKFRPMEHPSFINDCSDREFKHYHKSLFRKIFREELDDTYFHEDKNFLLPYWALNYKLFKRGLRKIRNLIFVILAMQMSITAFYLYLLYQANDDLNEWFTVEHSFVDRVFSINTKLLHQKIMDELELSFDREFEHRSSTETEEMYYDRLREFIKNQIRKLQKLKIVFLLILRIFSILVIF